MDEHIWLFLQSASGKPLTTIQPTDTIRDTFNKDEGLYERFIGAIRYERQWTVEDTPQLDVMDQNRTVQSLVDEIVEMCEKT